MLLNASYSRSPRTVRGTLPALDGTGEPNAPYGDIGQDQARYCQP